MKNSKAVIKKQPPQASNLDIVFAFYHRSWTVPDALFADDENNFFLGHADWDFGTPRTKSNSSFKPVSVKDAMKWHVQSAPYSDSSYGSLDELLERAIQLLPD